MYAAIDYLQSPQFLIDVVYRLQENQEQIDMLEGTGRGTCSKSKLL
jgi:hypothetical protein